MYLLPSNLVNVITCWIILQITIALYARKGLTKKKDRGSKNLYKKTNKSMGYGCPMFVERDIKG